MKVRSIQDEDLPRYIDIRRQSLLECPAFVGPLAEKDASLGISGLSSSLATIPLEDYRFGCFKDSECLGVATLTRKSNPKYSHKVIFSGLYVLPDYRRQHVGSLLMQHRLNFAASLSGVRFATLQVSATNQRGRWFHESFGFVAYGTEPCAMVFNGCCIDFILMQRNIEAEASVKVSSSG